MKFGDFNTKDLFNFPKDSDNDEQGEPSFSLHEFKKWLEKQSMPETNMEHKPEENKDRKEELKEKFKNRFKEKLKKKRKKN